MQVCARLCALDAQPAHGWDVHAEAGEGGGGGGEGGGGEGDEDGRVRTALTQLLIGGTLGPENDAASADLVATAADRRLRALEEEGTSTAMECRAKCVALAVALRRPEAAALRRLRDEAGALFGLG
eukprot:4261982-Prymnesium_polylepis.3